MPSKVWIEIIYPNFNGRTIEICEWISNQSHTLYNGYNYLSMLRLKYPVCEILLEWPVIHRELNVINFAKFYKDGR